MFEGDIVQRVFLGITLILVDVAITEGLNGTSILTDDVDELIDILLSDVHRIFQHDPLHTFCAGWGGE